MQIKYTCNGPRTEEDPSKRKGCGIDLSELIRAIPDDGKTHEYCCPVCGNTGTVRKVVPEVM